MSMIGFIFFIRNVKIMIISKVILVLLLLITSRSAYCETQQGITAHPSMSTSSAYFDPKLVVCETVEKYKCKVFTSKECKKVFPTFVKSYVDWRDGDEGPQICACQVLTCDASLAKGLIVGALGLLTVVAGIVTAGAGSVIAGVVGAAALGGTIGAGTSLNDDNLLQCFSGTARCVHFPVAPGPPPFCTQFQSAPEVRTLMVSTKGSDARTFYNEKIRVTIGVASKRCADGTIVGTNATCIDGSTGTVVTSTGQNLSVNADGTESVRQNVQGGAGITNYFSTKLDGSEVCALNRGDSSIKGANLNVLETVCHPQIPLPRPTVTKGTIRDTIHVKFNGCPLGNSDCDFDIKYGETKKVLGKIDVKVIKPTIDTDHNLKVDVMRCKNTGKRLTPITGGYACPAGDVPADPQTVEDRNGSVMCLYGWKHEDQQFTVKRGDVYHYIRSYGNRVLRSVVVASLLQNGKTVDIPVPCGDSFKKITDYEQPVLDTMRPYVDHDYFVMSDPDFPSASTSGASTSPCKENRSIYSLGIPTITSISSDANYPITEQTILGQKYKYITTNYYKESDILPETEEPFYLTKDEVSDPINKLMDRDLYMNELCVSNFTTQSFQAQTTGSAMQFYTVGSGTHSCHFLKIQAWGGGEKGIIDGTKSRGGTAGTYVQAFLPVDPNVTTYIGVSVGKGGTGGQASSVKIGEATSVSTCTNINNPGSCTLILTAAGGGSSGITYATSILSKLLKFGKVVIGLSGALADAKVQIPNGSVAYNNIDYPAHYRPIDECTNSPRTGSLSASNSLPGDGGCINTVTNSYQSGANGRVDITCETWIPVPAN